MATEETTRETTDQAEQTHVENPLPPREPTTGIRLGPEGVSDEGYRSIMGAIGADIREGLKEAVPAIDRGMGSAMINAAMIPVELSESLVRIFGAQNDNELERMQEPFALSRALREAAYDKFLPPGPESVTGSFFEEGAKFLLPFGAALKSQRMLHTARTRAGRWAEWAGAAFVSGYAGRHPEDPTLGNALQELAKEYPGLEPWANTQFVEWLAENDPELMSPHAMRLRKGIEDMGLEALGIGIFEFFRLSAKGIRRKKEGALDETFQSDLEFSKQAKKQMDLPGIGDEADRLRYVLELDDQARATGEGFEEIDRVIGEGSPAFQDVVQQARLLRHAMHDLEWLSKKRSKAEVEGDNEAFGMLFGEEQTKRIELRQQLTNWDRLARKHGFDPTSEVDRIALKLKGPSTYSAGDAMQTSANLAGKGKQKVEPKIGDVDDVPPEKQALDEVDPEDLAAEERLQAADRKKMEEQPPDPTFKEQSASMARQVQIDEEARQAALRFDLSADSRELDRLNAILGDLPGTMRAMIDGVYRGTRELEEALAPESEMDMIGMGQVTPVDPSVRELLQTGREEYSEVVRLYQEALGNREQYQKQLREARMRMAEDPSLKDEVERLEAMQQGFAERSAEVEKELWKQWRRMKRAEHDEPGYSLEVETKRMRAALDEAEGLGMQEWEAMKAARRDVLAGTDLREEAIERAAKRLRTLRERQAELELKGEAATNEQLAEIRSLKRSAAKLLNESVQKVGSAIERRAKLPEYLTPYFRGKHFVVQIGPPKFNDQEFRRLVAKYGDDAAEHLLHAGPYMSFNYNALKNPSDFWSALAEVRASLEEGLLTGKGKHMYLAERLGLNPKASAREVLDASLLGVRLRLPVQWHESAATLLSESLQLMDRRVLTMMGDGWAKDYATLRMSSVLTGFMRWLGGDVRSAMRSLNLYSADTRTALSQFNDVSAMGKRSGRRTRTLMTRLIEDSDRGDLKQLMLDIRDINDPAMWDKLHEISYNSMLSGPQTHLVNILGNLQVQLQRYPEDMLTAALGRDAEGILERFRASQGFTEALYKAWQMAIRSDALTQNDLDLLEAFLKTDKIDDWMHMHGAIGMTPAEKRPDHSGIRNALRAFGAGVARYGLRGMDSTVRARAQNSPHDLDVASVGRIPTELLRREDVFFKYMAYWTESNRLARQAARAEGKDPDALGPIREREEIHRAAVRHAEEQTFTNRLGELGESYKSAARSWQGLRLLTPFINVPVNLGRWTLLRTPLAYAARSVREAVKEGGEAGARAHARVAIGSLVMGTVSQQVLDLDITGAIPPGHPLYGTGIPPYSIKFAGKWYGYERTDPVGMLIGMSADITTYSHLMQNPRANDDLEEMAAAGVFLAAENLASDVFARTVMDFLEVLDKRDLEEAMRFMGSQGVRFVPYSAFARQLDRATEDFVQSDKGDPHQVWSWFSNRLEAMHPWMPGENDGPLRFDMVGRPLKRGAFEGGWADHWSSPLGQAVDFLNPIRIGEDPEAALSKAQARHTKKNTAETGRALDQALVVDAVAKEHPGLRIPSDRRMGVRMTQKQYGSFSRRAGELFAQMGSRAIRSRAWEMSDAPPSPESLRSLVLKNLHQDALRQAFLEALQENPDLRQMWELEQKRRIDAMGTIQQ